MLPSLSRLPLHPDPGPEDDPVNDEAPVGGYLWGTQGILRSTPALGSFMVYAAKVTKDQPKFLGNGDDWIYVALHFRETKTILEDDPKAILYGYHRENRYMRKVRFYLRPAAADEKEAKLYVQTSNGRVRSQYYWTAERAEWGAPTLWNFMQTVATGTGSRVKAEYDARGLARNLSAALGVALVAANAIPDKAIAHEFFEMLKRAPPSETKLLTFEKPEVEEEAHFGALMMTGDGFVDAGPLNGMVRGMYAAMLRGYTTATAPGFGEFKFWVEDAKDHADADLLKQEESTNQDVFFLGVQFPWLQTLYKGEPLEGFPAGDGHTSMAKVRFYATEKGSCMFVRTAIALKLRNPFYWLVPKAGWEDANNWKLVTTVRVPSASEAAYRTALKDRNIVTNLIAVLRAAVDTHSHGKNKSVKRGLFFNPFTTGAAVGTGS